jgi:hypothetical protein
VRRATWAGNYFVNSETGCNRLELSSRDLWINSQQRREKAKIEQVFSAKIEGLDRGNMLGLKTVFSARKYTRRVVNSLGKTGAAFLIDDRIFQSAVIGGIYDKAA